jgi:plastocyanin
VTVANHSSRRFASVLALAALAVLLVACAGAPPNPPAGTAATTLQLSADNLAFDRDVLTVPADTPFAIDFENREAAPHNVNIRGDAPLFVGEIFSGPNERRLYQVPALPAGEYEFLCDVHPDMRGTVISE